jgi:hypothetical protein
MSLVTAEARVVVAMLPVEARFPNCADIGCLCPRGGRRTLVAWTHARPPCGQ